MREKGIYILICAIKYKNAQLAAAALLNTGSMPHLSRYHTLHVVVRVVRGMRIWRQMLPNAAKCW